MQQITRGVVRADRLAHRSEDRPGIELEHNPEGRRARCLITGQDRVLDWCRPSPGRQQREVQVDPTVPRDVQYALRKQRAIGDDRAAVWGQLGQPSRRTPRRAGAAASRPRCPARRRGAQPGWRSASCPGRSGRLAGSPRRASSWRESASASSDGIATSGVPPKTIRTAGV